MGTLGMIGLVLAGDGFAAQGLHGEALERYRRALDMDRIYLQALEMLASPRAREAFNLAVAFLRLAPRSRSLRAVSA